MKQNQSVLLSGNRKGFIISLDLMLGLLILVGLFLFSVVLIGEKRVDYAHYEMLRMGGDIVIILDQQGDLITLDNAHIETSIATLLPPQYGMTVRIQGEFGGGNQMLDAGDDIPQVSSVVVGEYITISAQNEYLHIYFFVWNKEGQS